MDPETHFQILLFNEETTSILPTRSEEWFSTKDRKTMTEVITRLNNLVPKGGANMEKAFTAVRFLPRLPESLEQLDNLRLGLGHDGSLARRMG